MSEKSNNMEERTSRSAVACNACRTRKQKCGGEKPSCARCRQLDLECVWPRQQKRGPAKGYTEALEARLAETEDVLFRALSCISTEDLSTALLASPLESGGTYSKSGAPDRKQAVESWSKSSLKTLADIQNWYDERRRATTSATEPENSTSTLQDLAEHASFQPTANSDERNMSMEYVQTAKDEQQAMNTISGGDFRGGGMGNLEPIEFLESRATSDMMYSTGAGQQRHANLTNSQQHQHYQQQHQQNSTMSQMLPPTSGSTSELTQQTDSTRTKNLGLTQKFQEDFLW